VAGHRLYVCAPEPPNEAGTPRSGCIIYDGVADDLVRKKFRAALSFAFGVYLVETGHTFFDKDWQVVSATAKSAYSLWQRAFDLPMQPLMWLTDLNRQYDISRDTDTHGRALLCCIRGPRSCEFELGVLACARGRAPHRPGALRCSH
jgi:hypothetical protein